MNLSLTSSLPELTEGFAWAVKQAHANVQTGQPGKIPCYWCGLLDREHFCIRDFAHQALGGHLLGLELENLSMLRAFAQSATESRQWYPIWILGFDGDVFHQDYHHDNDFVREVPMVFELVEAGYQLWKWTGSNSFIHDPVLWSYYTRALNDFVRLHDRLGDGIAGEHGDSGWPYRGICTYNEGAEAMIQGADAVASQYHALLCYAEMQQARGEETGAAESLARAKKLHSFFNTEWWIESEKAYVQGRTKDGHKRTGWLEIASMYPASKFLIEPGPRAERHLDMIEAAVPYKTWKGLHLPHLEGIEFRTYLPEVFFPYGRNESGWKRLAHIYDARCLYPEVSFTLVGNTVAGLAGVEPDAPRNAVSTLSHLPKDLAWVAIDHFRLGEHDLGLRHEGARQSQLVHFDGPGPITWEVRFEGPINGIRINQTAQPVHTRSIHGRTISYATVEVHPGRLALAVAE